MRGTTCAHVEITDGGATEARVTCWGLEGGLEPAGCPADFAFPRPLGCTVYRSGTWESSDGELGAVEGLAGGLEASCALLDGAPWCWGHNGEFALGNPEVGRSLDSATPVPRTGRIVQISAADDGACARDESGRVACWGEQQTTLLAQSSESTFAVPIGVEDAIDVAATNDVSCAVRSDGTVWCWGGVADDDAGLINGDGAATVPTEIEGLDDVRSVTRGGLHACALRNDGSVWCWGSSLEGATGRVGADACDLGPCDVSPVAVSGIGGDVVELAAGGVPPFGLPGFTCARLADGGVSCWGAAAGLGDGTLAGLGSEGRPTPARVPGIDDAIALRASHVGVCALRASGRMACWGYDAGGTLGTTELVVPCGPLSGCAPSPVEVTAIRDVVDFAMDLGRTCATTSDGRVWCWGGAGVTEGLPDTGPRPRAPVPSIAFPDQLAVSSKGHCGLVAGEVLCWGTEPTVASGGRGDSSVTLIPTYVFGL